MNTMRYFVTATDTGSGKTWISALLCYALQGAYWKPIQAGKPTDSHQIRSWLGPKAHIFPEAYRLQKAASPHEAAFFENTRIDLKQVPCPKSKKPLIIEGAGGLMVPLNETFFMIDLLLQCQAQVILVINTYLGCINHGLLSAQLLKTRKAAVRGIIFNGPPMPESENAILTHSGYPCLLRIPKLEKIDNKAIAHYAKKLKKVFVHEVQL